MFVCSFLHRAVGIISLPPSLSFCLSVCLSLSLSPSPPPPPATVFLFGRGERRGMGMPLFFILSLFSHFHPPFFYALSIRRGFSVQRRHCHLHWRPFVSQSSPRGPRSVRQHSLPWPADPSIVIPPHVPSLPSPCASRRQLFNPTSLGGGNTSLGHESENKFPCIENNRPELWKRTEAAA